MSPSRRSFLRRLLALPIAATLDVEKLLWVPGELISVPTLPHFFEPRYYSVQVPISLEEINRVTASILLPTILDTCFKESPLMAYFKGDQFQITGPASRPSWERAQ